MGYGGASVCFETRGTQIRIYLNPLLSNPVRCLLLSVRRAISNHLTHFIHGGALKPMDLSWEEGAHHHTMVGHGGSVVHSVPYVWRVAGSNPTGQDLHSQLPVAL